MDKELIKEIVRETIKEMQLAQQQQLPPQPPNSLDKKRLACEMNGIEIFIDFLSTKINNGEFDTKK